MGLDLTLIAAPARAELIETGRHFSSEVTLEQAKATLRGYEAHGPKLTKHGFVAADATELKDAHDMLIEAGVGRLSKRATKREDVLTYAEAMRDGQTARQSARSVLGVARRLLMRAGSVEAARAIDVVLERDSAAPDDAEAMAKQLDALGDLLKDTAVAAVVAKRGGPEALSELKAQAAMLRDSAMAKAGPLGTPVETDTLDLIDGIIVQLVRSARDAAEVASKQLADPAILAAFELGALYKRKRRKGEEK